MRCKVVAEPSGACALAALLAGRIPDARAARFRGGRHNASNVRNRLLAECVRRATLKREAEGKLLLPERVTPHTLRRTFATLALAAGRDPR